MSSATNSRADEHIGTRIEGTKKRKAKMRAAQLGYDNLSDYLRALVDDDLEDADLPALE